MKTYVYAIVGLAVFVAEFWFIGPALVSANSDAAVLLGVLTIFLAAAALALLCRRWSRTTQGASVLKNIKENIK